MTTHLVASLLNVPAKPAAKPQASQKMDQTQQFDPNEGDQKQNRATPTPADAQSDPAETPKTEVAAGDDGQALPKQSAPLLGLITGQLLNSVPLEVSAEVVEIQPASVETKPAAVETLPTPQLRGAPIGAKVAVDAAQSIDVDTPVAKVSTLPLSAVEPEETSVRPASVQTEAISKPEAIPLPQVSEIREVSNTVAQSPVASKMVVGTTDTPRPVVSAAVKDPADIQIKPTQTAPVHPDQKITANIQAPPVVARSVEPEKTEAPLRDQDLRAIKAAPKVEPTPTAPPSAPTAKLQAPELAATALQSEPEILHVDAREQRLTEAERLFSTVPKDAATPRVVQQTQAIAQQISAAVARSPDGTIQIRLDPAELGRVTVTLPTVDGTGAAVVTAERPDVLDLLRRNENMLQKEMAAAGFENLEFSFSQEKDNQQNQQQPDEAMFAQDNTASANSDLAFARGATSEAVTLDRIDIRL